MKASLYEALGITPTASDEEVRAALRRLIRKYYAKTRDGQGNVEEALRFINHASRILSDPDRRNRYNGELAQSDGDAASPAVDGPDSGVALAAEGTDVAVAAVDSDFARAVPAAADQALAALKNAEPRLKDAFVARNQ